MALLVPQLEPCPFCEYLAGCAEWVVVRRAAGLVAFVNPRQYERGALLVIPDEHVPTLLELSPQSLSALALEAQALAAALVRALGATGVNVFTNSGVDAGQTVPHVHLHVVPRYPGGDARRVFREADFEVTPMAEREQLASEVRKALADPAAHADEPRPG